GGSGESDVQLEPAREGLEEPPHQAPRQEPDQAVNQAKKQTRRRDYQEPEVAHGLEEADLLAQGQELLSHSQREPELAVPVQHGTREPGDKRTKQAPGEHATNETTDRATGHHRPERQAPAAYRHR